MMENAGKGLAILAKRKFLQGDATKELIVVLAGTGGNGGGALVCARRLSAWGYDVKIILTDQTMMTPVPQHQLGILMQMGINVGSGDDLKTCPKQV